MPRFFFPFLLTFLGLWLGLSQARAQTVFRIDSLPVKGIILDKNWKWQLGDDPAWGRSDFDDAHWDTLNPTSDMALLHQLPQEGIGWLRIWLQIPAQLRGKPIGMFMLQTGATELFLNGQLVAQNGEISPQKQLKRGVSNKTLPFISLETDSVQLLAVRYAFSTERLRFLKEWRPFLRINIVSAELAEEDRINQVSSSLWGTMLFGIFLALGILQLLLFVASTQQRAALNLGLFLVTQGITYLIAAPLLPETLGITRVALVYDYKNIAFTVVLTVSGYCYLRGIYQYFNQPKRFLFFIMKLSKV